MEGEKEKKISVSRRVMNAILKLQESKGVSLVNLKKYLRDEKNLDVNKYNEEIKLALKSGLDRDILVRQNGMYKVKEAKQSGDKGAKTLDGRGKTSQKRSEREKTERKSVPTAASLKKASGAKRVADKGAKRSDGRGKTSQKSEKAKGKRSPTGSSRKKAPAKCNCVMCS